MATVHTIMDNQLKLVTRTTRVIEGWIFTVLTGITITLSVYPSHDPFYRFGPSSTFVILGITIDTALKYSIIVLYCIINTIIGSLHHQISYPWITLVIHDTTICKSHISAALIYEFSLVSRLYLWIDWFIYINILLSQVDVVIVQFITEIICTIGITYMYLNNSSQTDPAQSQMTQPPEIRA